MSSHVYDLECYPNVFLFGCQSNDKYRFYEISWRKNEVVQLLNFLDEIKNDVMTGFNNLSYDYPLLHYIIQNRSVNALDIYKKSDSIIQTDWNDRFSHIVWRPYIKQQDLLRIHHMDNVARLTSLKTLEFNMRSHNICDLPYIPGSILNYEQMDNLIKYLKVDIENTEKFYHHSEDQIQIRKELSIKYDHDFTNYNDTKIGKEYLLIQLEKTMQGFNRKNQTIRDSICLRDVILPYVQFEQPEFRRVHNWIANQTITETKNVLMDLRCMINDFTFEFGTGGIHGSIDPCVVESDDGYIIYSIDVKSYYPNLAIVNRLHPEHLGEKFCDVYKDVYELRQQYAKGTAENAMLKLALNGTYGDSNNKYSPFFDSKFTMAITINGQLLLCMLAEQLMKIPNSRILMINTDGLEIKINRKYIDHLKKVCNWWEGVTGLILEHASYNRLHIMNVNNYIAEYPDGKLKRKGTYCYGSDLGWHQNHSAQVVQMAAEAALIRGENLEDFIAGHSNIFDFMSLAKVPRSSKLAAVDYDGVDHQIQNSSRYYISVLGVDLIKIMPPLPKQLALNAAAPDRRFMLNKGWKATVCNDMDEYDDSAVEFEFYIHEAHKIVDPILKGGVL